MSEYGMSQPSIVQSPVYRQDFEEQSTISKSVAKKKAKSYYVKKIPKKERNQIIDETILDFVNSGIRDQVYESKA